MHAFTQRLTTPHPQPTPTLTLPFEQRTKARLRVTLDSGSEAGLFLPRGLILRDGDQLATTNGESIVTIRAAAEPLSVAVSRDPLQLLRASYHLGNRHILLQIGDGWLRYLHDHVLDEMVAGLGLTVHFAELPFEPEGGAYFQSSATHHH